MNLGLEFMGMSVWTCSLVCELSTRSLWGFVFCSALDYNRLSGPIPPSLGGLSKLTWFDVAYNGLTGPIPVSKTIPRDWVLTPCQTFSTCKSPPPGHRLPCQTAFLGSVFTLIYGDDSQGYISSLFLLVLGGV